MPGWGWALIGILTPVGTAMIALLWKAGYKLGSMDTKLDGVADWQKDHDARHVAEGARLPPRS